MFHPQGPTFWELARQALSSTRRGYDLLAPKFDFTPFRTPDEILQAAAPLIGGPSSIASALDLCCGTGAAMRMLRPLCRQRVVGIDFSPGMLAIAQQHAAEMPGTAELEFVLGDALDLPFQAEFDVVVSFGALGHFLPADYRQLVQQVAKVLKPGGRFIFASSYMPSIWSRSYWLSRGFNAAMHLRNAVVRPPFLMFYLQFLVPEAKQLLEATGFRVEIHQSLFQRPYHRACLVIAQLETGG